MGIVLAMLVIVMIILLIAVVVFIIAFFWIKAKNDYLTAENIELQESIEKQLDFKGQIKVKDARIEELRKEIKKLAKEKKDLKTQIKLTGRRPSALQAGLSSLVPKINVKV